MVKAVNLSSVCDELENGEATGMEYYTDFHKVTGKECDKANADWVMVEVLQLMLYVYIFVIQSSVFL